MYFLLLIQSFVVVLCQNNNIMGNIIDLPVEVTYHSLFTLFEEERAFKTSLNIIGEVLNVPMCALSSILRA